MNRKMASFKRIILILCTIVMIISFDAITFATEDPIRISINGQSLAFNSVTGIPFVDENGRTQVPFRRVLEAFGATVDWNQETYVATTEKNGVKVEVPIGEKCIYKNGEKISTDTTAIIKNGRTYLPIRAVIEALGGIVEWFEYSKTVIVSEIVVMKNPEIVYFNIPKVLEETRLTKQEAEALVGKSPEEVQSKIGTVYDLLQYLKSSGYADVSGDIQMNYGGYIWHTNPSAEEAIISNKGNCGATANLVNYLLKDDYEEVGYLIYSADSGQGGHVFNYIKKGSKYYVIDVLQFVMQNYSKINYVVYEYDDLSQSVENVKRGYSAGGTKQIKVIVSYVAKSQLPIGQNMNGDGVMRYLPTGSVVNVLYETASEGKIIEFVDVPMTN